MSEWPDDERLYDLLPAFYRLRDHTEGEPLRALLAIIQQEVELMEGDIESLYENWFVETAAEWVLPYIGDLLGVTNLHTVPSASVYSLRAYFANTLRYRQRKGTAAVLEQLADDITGWEARVVEFFQLLATTQHLNHVRLQNVRTPDLRDSNALELLGSSGQLIRNPNNGQLLLDLYRSRLRDSPFHQVPHTGEVRRIAERQGHFNIPNIGIFLWRLQAYPLEAVDARQVDPANNPNRYTFNQLGLDAPLFNRPQEEPEIAHIATEINTPTPLRRRALYDELEQLRAALVSGESPALAYFADNPVFRVMQADGVTPVPMEEITVCNLSNWGPVTVDPALTVAVDPVLGRLVFTGNNVPDEPPVVWYNYGFSADVGGGPYDRNDSLPLPDNRVNPTTSFLAQVNKAGGPNTFTSLADAIVDWNASQQDLGVIGITDNHTYSEPLPTINLTAGKQLFIIAAREFDATQTTRLDLSQRRPHLIADLTVFGDAQTGDPDPGTLWLNGLLIEGSVVVSAGNLGHLVLQHCTLDPRTGNLRSDSNQRLHVELEYTICGGIELADDVNRLTICDSIIDNKEGPDILAPGADVHIERSTVWGQDDDLDGDPTIRVLYASETIFIGRLKVERRQVGCVRFCVLPLDSRTPRRFRCQPDMALEDVSEPAERNATILRLRPQFTASTYRHPAYAQLSRRCALEIRTGAEDGSEMGVFNLLKQPQREANLRVALDEYTPFGMQTGIFYVT